MTNFDLLLATSIFLRGLGAGVIFGVAIMTLPVRKRLGTTVYATFIKAHYKERGVKIYAGITVLGLLLTSWLEVIVYHGHYTDLIKYCTMASLLATIFGFVGTAGAFPAMNELWKSADYTTIHIAKVLDKFAFWHIISALAHIVAFILLLVVLIIYEKGN